MLSRGNIGASTRLRRAKSSSSVKKRATENESQYNDPEVARQHALVAASIAFDRAGGRTRASSDSREGLRNGFNNVTTGDQDANALRRQQSVRFTGPTAAPNRQRSITRRTAPAYKDFDTEMQHHGRKNEAITQDLRSFLTALPPVSSLPSTPSSYRKLRKTKSMFSPLKRPPITFSNATPKSYEIRQQYRRLSSDDHRPPPKMADPRTSFSLSQHTTGQNQRQNQYVYDQDAAIQLARNQYLRQLEQQRLKEKPSILSMSKRRSSQKAFRKTVRTSSTNSYDNAVGSSQVSASSKKKGLGNRARNLSSTLKEKLKRVFHRHSEDEYTFPSQQVEAQRLHFGDFLSTTSGVDYEGLLPPAPDGELLSRVSSRKSSIHRMPVQLDRGTSPGSIRSVRSHSPSTGRSRITSWTNSTATNTLTKQQQLLEKKRLSIIQENGGPHQPSSSAGLIGTAARKGYAVFRKPLRGAAGSNKNSGPVDSQRIFSALQKRLDEHNRAFPDDRTALDEHPAGSSVFQQTSQESLRKASLESHNYASTTIRMLEDQSDESLHDMNETRLANKPSFSSIVRKPVNTNSGFLEGRITYQQIAERNESLGRGTKKQLREVKSAFFPATAHYQPKSLSPYRRALQSSIEEERSLEEYLPQKSAPKVQTIMQPKLALPFDSSLSSSSVYSRSASGTPNPPEPFAPTNSSKDNGDLGTATIIEKTPPYLMRPRTPIQRRDVSSTKSCEQWQGWMASEIANFEQSGRTTSGRQEVNKKPSASHRREHAQIDGDDVQISTRYKWGPLSTQAQGEMRANDVFRPALQHKKSDQMDEKFPLRFPLLERTTSSGTTTTIKRNTAAPPVSGQPPAKVNSKQSAHYSSAHIYLRPGDLHEVMSEISKGERKDQTQGFQVLADSTNSSGIQRRNALKNIQTHSSTNLRSRYSPERAERLRRMQCSNAMISKENVKTLSMNYQGRHHQHENQAINDLTPISSPGGDSSFHGTGILEPVGTDVQAAGSQKMVELFLSKRRNGQSMDRTSSPVFI